MLPDDPSKNGKRNCITKSYIPRVRKSFYGLHQRLVHLFTEELLVMLSRIQEDAVVH